MRAPPAHPLHKTYHDQEYGFPILEDDALFARLVLEINQAGLSWTTILQKKDNFMRAFDGFEIERVAAYGEADVARLLADAGIIRNRLKVAAAIENARRILQLRAAARLLCRLAGCASPPAQGGLGQALQENLRFHRRRDRGRIPASAPATCPAPTSPGARPTSES